MAGTEKEVWLLAHTLRASCSQTGQLIKNISGEEIADATYYQEIWPLTLAVYHAGAGCMAEAIETAWDADEWLVWRFMEKELPAGCDLAKEYVRNVLRYGGIPTQQVLFENP